MVSALCRCLSDAVRGAQNSKRDRFEFGWDRDGTAVVRTSLFAARLLFLVLGLEARACLERACPALFHGHEVCALKAGEPKAVSRQVKKLSSLTGADFVEELGALTRSAADGISQMP